ncbi:MAG: hybrid sensor histidine kinase/response regulator, partial [Candidatus Hydrogenedentes bacterium]|nr:hybrid sensor histidine kinase/response regulator [Candidatus Hydrogenedentota bacterium]
ALDGTIDKIKAFAAGGVDYVTKPFQFEEVEARVQTHLKLHQLQIELEIQNRQLQENYDRLRKLEELRDSLTHMVVHDMRSPLTIIMLGLDIHIQQAAAKLNEAEMEPVVEAASSVNMLVEMVNSLLDVSRLESGKMPIHIEECDLTGLTCEVIKSLKNLKQDCQLEVARQDPAMVRCDRELIRRVLTNIGTNAVKFVPENGRVRFDIQNDDAGVKMLISDNGFGIPREYHAKVFEKFGQVEARKEDRMYSTGLGLTFCKLAVEAHGGRIGVESEVDKGSTFWFTLPA